MNMRKARILGIIIFALGILSILNANINITGAVIGISLESCAGYIMGITLMFISIILLATDLEERVNVKVYETGKGAFKRTLIEGLTGVSSTQIIQANAKPVMGEDKERIMNLDRLKEIVKDCGIEEKDVIQYLTPLKEKVREGYKAYFSGMAKNNKITPEEKKKLRLSIGAERVIDVLTPEYKTRKEKLNELKKNPIVGSDLSVYNPILRGTATYVHFTSSADDIIKSGFFEGKQQAIYFPSLEKAKEFAGNINRADAKKLTGTEHADQAIIFQTYEPPKDINKLSGEKTRSMRKAFFNDLKTDSCYTFMIQNISR